MPVDLASWERSSSKLTREKWKSTYRREVEVRGSKSSQHQCFCAFVSVTCACTIHHVILLTQFKELVNNVSVRLSSDATRRGTEVTKWRCRRPTIAIDRAIWWQATQKEKEAQGLTPFSCPSPDVSRFWDFSAVFSAPASLKKTFRDS